MLTRMLRRECEMKIKYMCFAMCVSFSAQVLAGGKSVEREISMESSAGYVAEHCIWVKPGNVLDYETKAPFAVNFNIHFHTANDVVYPVKEDKVLEHEGQVVVESKGEYCFMWKNIAQQNADYKIALHYKITK